MDSNGDHELFTIGVCKGYQYTIKCVMGNCIPIMYVIKKGGY